MIQSCRFGDFVYEFLKTYSEEREEKHLWEFYLHRWIEEPFEDFRESVKKDRENQNMTAQTIENTVQNSLDILNNFNPTGGE